MPARLRLSMWMILTLSTTACFATSSVQQSCQNLQILSLPTVTIVSATFVPAGPYTPPPDSREPLRPISLPAYCRVKATTHPTADSDIKFEVWLPTITWNGKFQQVGNGGFAGSLPYRKMVAPLVRGYATAATDDGHTGGTSVTWAIGHPEKVIDFGYRAVHDTAVQSKKIVSAFYSRAPSRAYFEGCSDGGREALMEAQRFPDDFDGIITGAPASNWTHQFAGFIWNEEAIAQTPAGYIPEDKLLLLQRTVREQCGRVPAATKGAMEGPLACHFDPAVLECRGSSTRGCLSPAEARAIGLIYAGPKNPRTGKQIYPGYEPGDEAIKDNWPIWIVGTAPGKSLQAFFGNAFFGEMVYGRTDWDFRSFDFDSDVAAADAKFGPILNARNPDLSRFEKHGGRLIEYHGWADSAAAPLDSIAYYQNVVERHKNAGDQTNTAALQRTKRFYRLFLVPGMGHCLGGVGANNFGNYPTVPPPILDAGHDLITALDEWVEKDVAPDRMIATEYVDGMPEKGVAATHPLCPYPQQAIWNGRGRRKAAESFVCRNGTKTAESDRSYLGGAKILRKKQ